MGKTLITGATGFLGSHLARALAARGDELRLLVRGKTKTDHLDGIEFERATGGITDRRAVAKAMKGVDRVFHVAGTTSLRAGDAQRVMEVNVGGTINVMDAALAEGVKRVVHTSSVAGIGPAPRGGRADESQAFTAGELGIPYVTSKHEAELEAMRAAAHGLEVVVTNPTFVLGPDDPYGTSMALVRRFLRRQIPVYVDGALNVVDVRDVAAGHLLADEKGEPGERYILGGRNFTLKRLFADLSRISGVEPPRVELPGELAARGVEIAHRLGIPLPTSPGEARSGALWWTYTAAKAKRELGFSPRPHEQTLRDAVEWQSEQLGDRVVRGSRPADPLWRAAGSATGLARGLLGR